MRVLIFVCGEGLGHTTRCVSIGKGLAGGGHEVSFGAYGYSIEMLRRAGFEVHEVPQEVRMVGAQGGFDIWASTKATVLNPAAKKFPGVLRLLKEASPDVVVSDMYYAGMTAAILKKKPFYVVTNQTEMIDSFRNKGAVIAALGELGKAYYTSVFNRALKIIVPDYPMPHTICRANIKPPEEMKPKIYYAGPITRMRYADVKAARTRRPHVLTMMGGFGYRSIVFKKMIEVARLDGSVSHTLILGPNVREMEDCPGNVMVIPTTEDPLPYVKASDLVVSSGGHSTIMEAVSFGVPVLSFPDDGQMEQQNNAAVLQEEGLGRRMGHSASPEDMLGVVREMLGDGSFKRNALKYRKLSEGLDGPAAVRRLLESGK